MHSSLRVLLGLAGIAITPIAFATNGYFTHGYGVQAQGTAGTAIALPQDALAIANNPAGISSLGQRADIGATLFNPDRSASIKGNAAGANGQYDGNSKEYFVIPEFGYIQPLAHDVTVGLALYGNGGMNTNYKKNPYAAFGNSGSAGVNLTQIFLSPAVAWQFAEGQSIGVSANLLYQRFSATGIQGFAGFSENGKALSDQGNDSSTGIGARLGWSGQLGDKVTLGATWASKIKATRFKKYEGLFAGQGDFDVPENYGIGIAYRPVPQLALSADVQRIEYGDIKSVANPFSVQSLGAGNIFGSSNGVGFGWNSINVYKLGAVYQYSPALTLRAGYSHSDQPVPASQTLLNILAPGVIQDHASLGATWQVNQHSELSVAYTHGFKNKVSGKNSIPANFGGGEANLEMNQHILALAYGYKF